MKQWIANAIAIMMITACGGGGGTPTEPTPPAQTTDQNESNGTNTIPLVVSVLPIKKTGQTLSYNESGIEVTDGSAKDDGFYQKGITPSYTRDDAKEVVTDNVTGLMWQDNEEAASVTKPWVTEKNYYAGNFDDMSGDTATTYCADLSLGGYSDWRLPSYDELESIFDYGGYGPAIDPVFINTASSYYSSATTRASNTSYAWRVYFGVGGDSWGDKSRIDYVRCVR